MDTLFLNIFSAFLYFNPLLLIKVKVKFTLLSPIGGNCLQLRETLRQNQTLQLKQKHIQ